MFFAMRIRSVQHVCGLIFCGAIVAGWGPAPRAVVVGRPVAPSTRQIAGRDSAVPGSRCAARWHVVRLPAIGTSTLQGIAALSTHAVWVVGSRGRGSDATPLLEYWDGVRWQVAPPPALPGIQPSVFDNVADPTGFNAVTAISPHDVWAVGAITANSHGHSQALIGHWNGSRWSSVTAMQPGANSILRAIAASGPGDVWAVGDVGTRRTLVEHWDGRRWSIVPSPSPSAHGNTLSGVSVLSATDVWAVGASDQGDGSSRGLIEHWDGLRWHVVPSPNDAVDRSLNSASAVSATDVWAVGSTEGNDYVSIPLVERWDGRSWRDAAAPRTAVQQTGLTGVAAVSAHDAWAVAGSALAHWDGTRWRTVGRAAAGSGTGTTYTEATTEQLAAVVSISSGAAWAAGQTVVNTDLQNTALVRAYDSVCRG